MIEVLVPAPRRRLPLTVVPGPGRAAAERPALCALIGPTATGKNALGVAVAEALDFEIVSLDAIKVFRRLDIGTAKPSAALRARVRHHALDLVEPWEPFDVTRYLEAAEVACAEIQARGRRPLFVGGTGLYLHLLLYGQFAGPGPDPALRAALGERYESEGPEALAAELRAVDPQAADRIHPNDRKRLIRALEVYASSGRPISAWQTQFGAPRTDVTLVLAGLQVPRPVLDERIDARTRAMFDAGWIDEVRAVRAVAPGGPTQAFGPQAREALGYRELNRFLAGDAELPDEAALSERVAQRTRRLARKQMTWFARHPVTWFAAETPDATMIEAVTAHFRAQLV